MGEMATRINSRFQKAPGAVSKAAVRESMQSWSSRSVPCASPGGYGAERAISPISPMG